MKPPARAIRLFSVSPGLQLVDAGRVDLAFERDQARLARHRDAHVLLAVDGDDVARREGDVVGLVALQDRLAEVEGDHLGAQVGVEPLDRRVVPVQLVEERGRRALRAGDDGAVFGARAALAARAVGSSSRSVRMPVRRRGRRWRALPARPRCCARRCSLPAALPLPLSRSRSPPRLLRSAGAIVLVAQARPLVVVDHLHEQVLAPVEVGRDERVAVGDQVADAHARRERIAQRLGDVALQRHRVGELRRDREQGHDVAVAQRLLQAGGVEAEGLDEARRERLRRIDALELDPVRIGEHRRAAGVAQHLAQRLLRALQLVDRRRVDRAGDGDARPGRLEDDDVAGGELHVLRLVALDQELVDVELGDDLAVAAQQDLAHRARRARAARGDDRREQRRLARQRDHAGPLRRADDEHAQAAQLAERDREIEVGEQAPDLRAQVLLEVGGLDAGDVEAADLGQVEHAVAVDRAAVVDVDRAPGARHDLVARADRVVGRDRHVVERLEVVGGVGEEARAEDRQQPSGRAFDEALELVRLRRRRRLGAAREDVVQVVICARRLASGRVNGGGFRCGGRCLLGAGGFRGPGVRGVGVWVGRPGGFGVGRLVGGGAGGRGVGGTKGRGGGGEQHRGADEGGRDVNGAREDRHHRAQDHRRSTTAPAQRGASVASHALPLTRDRGAGDRRSNRAAGDPLSPAPIAERQSVCTAGRLRQRETDAAARGRSGSYVRLRRHGERVRRMVREAAVVRVWDLPTRLFHWALAFGVVAAIVSARLGGAAMTWHLRLGYAIFTLLAFRLLWGFVGGTGRASPPSWSRRRRPCAICARRSWPHGRDAIGHSPLGAWSVLALLGVLVAQVATGLVADDEIASNGPLSRYVASATSAAASHWHRLYGQWIIVALVAAPRRRHRLLCALPAQEPGRSDAPRRPAFRRRRARLGRHHPFASVRAGAGERLRDRRRGDRAPRRLRRAPRLQP